MLEKCISDQTRFDSFAILDIQGDIPEHVPYENIRRAKDPSFNFLLQADGTFKKYSSRELQISAPLKNLPDSNA